MVLLDFVPSGGSFTLTYTAAALVVSLTPVGSIAFGGNTYPCTSCINNIVTSTIEINGCGTSIPAATTLSIMVYPFVNPPNSAGTASMIVTTYEDSAYSIIIDQATTGLVPIGGS